MTSEVSYMTIKPHEMPGLTELIELHSDCEDINLSRLHRKSELMVSFNTQIGRFYYWINNDGKVKRFYKNPHMTKKKKSALDF